MGPSFLVQIFAFIITLFSALEQDISGNFKIFSQFVCENAALRVLANGFLSIPGGL